MRKKIFFSCSHLSLRAKKCLNKFDYLWYSQFSSLHLTLSRIFTQKLEKSKRTKKLSQIRLALTSILIYRFDV